MMNSLLARAKQLEAQGRSIIHLEIGQPDFPTPTNICEAACQAIQDGYTGYSPAAGLLEFRKVIADYICRVRRFLSSIRRFLSCDLK